MKTEKQKPWFFQGSYNYFNDSYIPNSTWKMVPQAFLLCLLE